MQHEPSGFLSHTESAMQFVAADSVFAAHHEPHCRKPLFKRNRGILKHGADLERELLFRMIAIAAIEPRLGEICDLLVIAIGAANCDFKPAYGNPALSAVPQI